MIYQEIWLTSSIKFFGFVVFCSSDSELRIKILSMGKMTCRRFVQYLLKMINLIFALIGLTMIGYGIYMIFSYNASSSSSLSSSSTVSLSAQSLISRPSDCNYLEHKIVDKNSNIRKCISQKCLDSCLFAWFWSDLPSAW